MDRWLIIVIEIVSIIAFIGLSKLYIWNKWINRLINILLFILLFVLPTSIACVCFALLVVRLVIWLFGPAQEMMDDYHYSRYRNARTRYNIRNGIQEKNANDKKIKKINEKELKNKEKEVKESAKKMDIMFSDNYKEMMSDYSKKITSIESLTQDDMYILALAYKKALLNKDSSMINKLQNIKSKNDITKEIKKYNNN